NCCAVGCGGGGCGACGGTGCASCGTPAHGADVYYDGMPLPGGRTAPAQQGPPSAQSHDTGNILDENWEIPRTKPVPGKPIHNAQQPPRTQTTRRAPPQMSQPVSRQQQMQRYQQPIGTGMRQANYEQ